MVVEQKSGKRPFHETLVEAIQQANDNHLECLGNIIMATKIPGGHAEIIAAWNKRIHEQGWIEDSFVRRVMRSLLEQQRELARSKEAREAFWTNFHFAWGDDRGDNDTPCVNYDKQAWGYVQARMERHFQKE